MPKGYGAGPMRQRVKVQGYTSTYDSYNQETKSYTTIGTHWAEVTFFAGRQVQNAMQNKEEVTHLVRMRWFPGLQPGMQILLDARVFNIIYINNVDEKDREYQLHCQEIVSIT